jgi:alpha,alpha-trehalase
MPDRVTVERIKHAIADQWDQTVRGPEDVQPHEVPLPRPYTVPCPGTHFRMFFYWDTYYTCVGLRRQGRSKLAKDNCENFLYLIDQLGHVPNFTFREHLSRSQPPHASLLVRDLYEDSPDREWLARAYPAMVREHAFWMGMRGTHTGLNRHYMHGSPKQVEAFAEEISSRLLDLPSEPAERMAYTVHAMAEAETGWDFNRRFSRRCGDYNPVDLNSLLYFHEQNCAFFADELGNGEGDRWRERAAKRRRLMDSLLWHEKEGAYFDYDFTRGERSRVLSVAVFYALWAGVASEAQAAAIVERALTKLECDFGVAACAPGDSAQVYQWDYPNGWPPSQHAVIRGLLRYGYHAEAKRIAEKYVDLVTRNYEATGQFWEKYNVVTGGIDVGDEYAMPPMLGWTAGVFLGACEVLGA